MQITSELPSQISFRFLSVPESHSVPFISQNDMDDDTCSTSGISNIRKETPYVPLNYIAPEAYTLLAAAEARRAVELHAPSTAMELDASHGSMLQDGPALEALPCMAPPKRFYRTFWQSITLKLVHQKARNVKVRICVVAASMRVFG
jgi:hypothetical protein